MLLVEYTFVDCMKQIDEYLTYLKRYQSGKYFARFSKHHKRFQYETFCKTDHDRRTSASVISGNTKSSLAIFHLRPYATKDGI